MEIRENRSDSVGSAVKIDTSFGHEGGGEFSLPDYLPEIQRLLALTLQVLPETKYLSGNLLEIGGTLSYNIIYSDADGNTACAPLVTEYSADCALSCQVDNVSEIICSTEAESNACRVTSPRGISIKTRLRTGIKSDESVLTDGGYCEADGKRASNEDEETVERLVSPFMSIARSRGTTTGSVGGEFTAKEGQRVLNCYAGVDVTDASALEGVLRVSGEISVRAILEKEGVFDSAYVHLPFENTVSLTLENDSCKARAWGRVASVSVVPNEADAGTYSVSVEYDLEAEALAETEIQVCSDAYSTKYDCNVDVKECDLLSSVSFGSVRLTLSGESTAVPEDKGEAVFGFPVSDSLQYSTTPTGGALTGSVKVKVLLAGDEITVSEVDIPVRYELPSSVGESQSSLFCSVLSVSVKSSQGKITATADVYLSWSILEKNKMGFVTSVSLGEIADKGKRSSVRAYYPQNDESMWSICKKYRADISRVQRANPDVGKIAYKGYPIIIC